MQYQLAGTDPSGRLIYEPVSQPPQPSSACACSHTTQQPTKRETPSTFAPWFLTEDGVISLSLKNLSVLFTWIVCLTLGAMGWYSCTYESEDYVCTVARWPMISDVINQEMYNRIFILMMTVYMYAVQQANLRATYKKLYGVVSDFDNDLMMVFGILATVALPMIGIFDESRWTKVHGFMAGVYFLCFCIYGMRMGSLMNANKAKYPQAEQGKIQQIYLASWSLLIATGSFCVCFALRGHGGWTAILEWVAVLYQLSFFAIVSQDNEFYQTVHEPVSAKK